MKSIYGSAVGLLGSRQRFEDRLRTYNTWSTAAAGRRGGADEEASHKARSTAPPSAVRRFLAKVTLANKRHFTRPQHFSGIYGSGNKTLNPFFLMPLDSRQADLTALNSGSTMATSHARDTPRG